MPLGIVADEINRDFAKAVKIGKPLGIYHYEIRFLRSGRVPICDESELREVELIANGENVTITALSPGLFKLTADETGFRREMNEVFPQTIELAQRWNLSKIITFGFHKSNATESDFFISNATPTNVFEWFAEADERAAEIDSRLLIEPEPICWLDTATRIAELIEKIDAKNIGINYDPGNVAWLLNQDPFDEFERIAPYIENVHVKNLREIQDGKPIWVIPNAGFIDYQKHFAALKKFGYNGKISLEPHLDGESETIMQCKTAVETLLKSIGENAETF